MLLTSSEWITAATGDARQAAFVYCCSCGFINAFIGSIRSLILEVRFKERGGWI